MAKAAFSLDTKKFLLDFTKITKVKIPTKAAKAQFDIGAIIIKDANTVEPTTPAKEFILRGSGKILVDKIKLDLKVGFNKDYAMKVHEAPWIKPSPDPKFPPKPGTWTTPGSGPKFLENKMIRFKNKYVGFLASRIKGP